MQIKKLFSISTWAIAALAILPVSAFADQTYVTNQGHTEVLFGWSHSGVSIQHAEFTTAKGTLNLADDIEKSSINVVIDAGSLSTGVAALDRHLKSKDYLEVSSYPEITFQSTTIKKTGERSFDVIGDLTMHGVTKPVTLKTDMTHHGQHPVGKFLDAYKGIWIAFRATTEINHQAFKVGSYSTGPITVEINTELKTR